METERLILCPFEETEGGYYEVKQEDVQNPKPYCRIRVYASCYAAEEHAVSFDVVEPPYGIRNG